MVGDKGLISFLRVGDISTSQNHLLKRLSFPHRAFLTSCQRSVDCKESHLFLAPVFFPLVYTSVFTPALHGFNYHSFVLELETNKCGISQQNLRAGVFTSACTRPGEEPREVFVCSSAPRDGCVRRQSLSHSHKRCGARYLVQTLAP